MEEKKKSKAPLIVLIVLLFLFAVAGSSLGGYLFGKNDANKENKEEKEIVEKELKESDVKDFLKRIDGMNSSLCTSYPISDINSIPTQQILSIGLGDIFGTYSISSDYIENHIKYILGDNVNIKHEDYLCNLDNIAFYKYNNGFYSYNSEHPGHGAGGGYIVNTFFKSAKIQDDTVIIDTNLLYEVSADISGPTTSYFDGASTDAKKVLSEIERDNLKSEYEKIKDTLPTTAFTFKRSELGGFNLESVVIK